MTKYLFLFLLLCGANAYAEVQRWVDEHGKVHYSDLPPAGIDTETLRSSSAATSGVSAPKTYVEREAELKKTQQVKREAEEAAAKKQANTETQKANCANAQKNLLTLQAGGRMVEYDTNGERRFVDEETLRQRIVQAQKEIGDWCK